MTNPCIDCQGKSQCHKVCDNKNHYSKTLNAIVKEYLKAGVSPQLFYYNDLLFDNNKEIKTINKRGE